MQQPGDVCRRRRWDGIHDGNGHLRPGGAAGGHGFLVAASAAALSKCWPGGGDQDAENRCCVGTVDDDVEAGRASSSEGADVVYLVYRGGQVGLMLQLLVLPGDSYYQWQRIRLERNRIVEPDLASVVARANEQLILGRPGEVWGAASALDQLVVVRSS
jgi:hypothetical protein